MPKAPANLRFSLDAKYTQEEGRIVLSGTQALTRLPLDQHRADRRQGWNTATLISGYRGSPLGGLDMTLARNQTLLQEHQVHFLPAVNEELAATALMGSQQANLLEGARYDGVLGIWYGKAPGVDRSGDAFKHANFCGVGVRGGVLALAGDDPAAKSSTIPSSSEVALYDAHMPVLYPGNVQEILDYGRFGFALSRYCGSWVGVKIVTNVADAFETAVVGAERLVIKQPHFEYEGQAWQPRQNAMLIVPESLDQERAMVTARLAAAQHFAAANQLNRVVIDPKEAWLGIAAAGISHYEVRQALQDLGLGSRELKHFGIRILKLGMLYPLEENLLRQFARGLEEIFVVEEKREFLELFIHKTLYGLAERPRIIGKRDEKGAPLLPSYGSIDADLLRSCLATRLSRRLPADITRAWQSPAATTTDSVIPLLARTPYYCSGCPHNRSTLVPKGSLAGAGIGCHTMALYMERETFGLTQMGGEGANWVGLSPFIETEHFFQNIGDGTLTHSGSLAIRQAVAAGVNLTFKILYNSAVAMTGGQQADGLLAIPELTRSLEAEGVRRIFVIQGTNSALPENARWADNTEVWPRERFDEAQELLREMRGVTALIYDQECAANLRRKRRRGQTETPNTRIFINEAVCEGCGDCGRKSNCLSVQPVQTEFGRKTQIHQSSCNLDYSCLEGDCPAFVRVWASPQSSKTTRSLPTDLELPEPRLKVTDRCHVVMIGIGGTGVVTTNQILGTAAQLSGLHIRSLDQTGLSQKGGAVVSHLKITRESTAETGKISAGQADVYLVYDLLAGVEEANLSRACAERSVAIVSRSEVPTGKMVVDTASAFPEQSTLQARIDGRTKGAENVYLDALGLAEEFFGDHMAANMIVLGVAYQRGLLLVDAASIEEAIALNGVAAEMNQAAFRLGRAFVVQPERLVDEQSPGGDSAGLAMPALRPVEETLLAQVGVPAGSELERILRYRIPELVAYQDVNYAGQYTATLREIYAEEQRRLPGQTRFSEAVARYLFKLMAYKDEYEVARLSLKEAFRAALRTQFGRHARYQFLLQPPFLRTLGLRRKLSFGRWFEWVYRFLVVMRRLRGTPMDPFGYAQVRRVERALIGDYRNLIHKALATLEAANYERACRLAELPDVIRGYEEIKLANVERFWNEAFSLGYVDADGPPSRRMKRAEGAMGN